MIDRRSIFRSAHAAAKVSAHWDRAAGSYRFHFARHLRDAYAAAARIELGRKMLAAAAAREAARDAQNFGLPLRSTPADRRSYFRSSRYVASVGA